MQEHSRGETVAFSIMGVAFAIMIGASFYLAMQAENTAKVAEQAEEILMENKPQGLGATPFASVGQVRFESVNNKTPSGLDRGGYAMGNAFSIRWGDGGADPQEILSAIKHRLTHMQSTDLASDQNARILWEVEKALDAAGGDPMPTVDEVTTPLDERNL